MLPRLVLFLAMSQRVKRDYPETSIAFAPLVQRFDKRSDMPESAIWSPTVEKVQPENFIAASAWRKKRKAAPTKCYFFE